MPEDAALRAAEPDDLDGIRALRPVGARRYWTELPEATYRDRIEGAISGRFAGCVLGSIVANWEVDKMERWAAYLGDAFPPTDYWSEAERPQDLKYSTSRPRQIHPLKKWTVCPPMTTSFTRSWVCSSWKITEWTLAWMMSAPLWMKYLSDAKTAEGVALRNLHAGVPPAEAAVVDNPFIHWIGADIRSDPWGYAAPGYPELAAEFAWRDATISHRRNGIYGAMYFSAVITAAFVLSDPLKALEAGLAEIPADCLLAREVRWGVG